MTHIEQVTEALTKLTGLPFEPSRGQRTELRKGETTEAVIATLPLQIADRRGDIAKQLSEVLGRDVSPDVIEPWMVAHLLRLDAPIVGFSDRSAWRDLRPDVLIQIGTRLADDTVAILYRDFLGRWPEPKGRAHYEAQIINGRPTWEIVREIELSDEAQGR